VVKSGRGAQAREQKVKLAGFIEVMGWKALGNKLADYTKSTEITWDMEDDEPRQGELF
jgi:topoisomerase-4 subunit A